MTAGRQIYLHHGEPPLTGYPVTFPPAPARHPFLLALDETFQEVGAVVRETFQQVWEAARSAWRIIPDEIREQAAINAGNRYWTDQRGRTRRTTGARPLLHNGRKP